ncbi:MAG: hypothetical protein KA314_28150 [Chloroflexi bacterium]|nr:hypothetical protein [Chloroflexota bacterium]MBP8059727.1 hypothetical protein [Chloroflexota bacterium]
MVDLWGYWCIGVWASWLFDLVMMLVELVETNHLRQAQATFSLLDVAPPFQAVRSLLT